ncbi:hypothetical protein C8R46DRAFT_1282573 [Mycena filopes]|nr:hypothetical protein C8R46DRAFT_1282573 [Mycena filopes]
MLRILDRIHERASPFTCSWTLASPTQIWRRLPNLPPEIWLEIFQWCTYLHHSTTIEPLPPFTLAHTPVRTHALGANTPILSMRTKCALVRVNRAWRRVALPLLYQHVVVRSPARAAAILHVLRDSSSGGNANYGYGLWTRHIELFTHARGATDIRFLQTVFRILQYCPRLRMLSATWRVVVPREFLDAVSRLYGPSLQGLYWDEQRHALDKTHAGLGFLASFQSLRVLDLRQFVGDGSHLLSGSAQATLPRLMHIILSTQGNNIAVAAALRLPALHTLTLQSFVAHPIRTDLIAALLAVHGRALTTVCLPTPTGGGGAENEPTSAQQPRTPAQHVPPALFLRPPTACPALDTIAFGANSPPIASPSHDSTSPDDADEGNEPHPALRRIALLGVRADALYPSKGPNETQGHLRSFTRAAYPRLETVRTAGFLVDADADSLVRDVFIYWGERFERDGVDFQDGEGVVWMYGEG